MFESVVFFLRLEYLLSKTTVQDHSMPGPSAETFEEWVVDPSGSGQLAKLFEEYGQSPVDFSGFDAAACKFSQLTVGRQQTVRIIVADFAGRGAPHGERAEAVLALRLDYLQRVIDALSLEGPLTHGQDWDPSVRRDGDVLTVTVGQRNHLVRWTTTHADKIAFRTFACNCGDFCRRGVTPCVGIITTQIVTQILP